MARSYPLFETPWDFAGNNTGVACHFLLQGIFLTQGWLAGRFFITEPPGKPNCSLHWDNTSLMISVAHLSERYNQLDLCWKSAFLSGDWLVFWYMLGRVPTGWEPNKNLGCPISIQGFPGQKTVCVVACLCVLPLLGKREHKEVHVWILLGFSPDDPAVILAVSTTKCWLPWVLLVNLQIMWVVLATPDPMG